ncbi:MAG: beta-ketoacyl-[acyl-carrier-protein] synthase II, partial [Deltaproteobacteria bacterium]|nr:beta-ketoacyl-[acyl-carrier-protein] synthase II [Deltaproteobacteria bacterium]
MDRGARIYAEILGWAHNSDFYSMMMLNPDGIQAEAVMKSAAKDAGISLDQIDYVQAHAS